MLFSRQLLKGFDVEHCSDMYIVRRYVVKLSRSMLDGKVIRVDGGALGSIYGKKNTIGKVKGDCGLSWRGCEEEKMTQGMFVVGWWW